MDFTKIIQNLNNREFSLLNWEKYSFYGVLAPLIKIEGRWHFVLEKRAKNISQGGEISFPGGRREPEETSLFCAIRESSEELGVSMGTFKPLGSLGELVLHNRVIEAHLAMSETVRVGDFQINKKEVEELLFVPVDFFKNKPAKIERVTEKTHPYSYKGEEKIHFPARELDLPTIYHKPWGSLEREVYFYEYQGELIWGLTAEIIKACLKYLD